MSSKARLLFEMLAAEGKVKLTPNLERCSSISGSDDVSERHRHRPDLGADNLEFAGDPFSSLSDWGAPYQG